MPIDTSASSINRATIRLLYLIVLAIALFVPKQPAAITALLALQLLLWLGSRLPLSELWSATRRLRLFFLLIFVAYAFVSTGQGNDRWLEGPYGLAINLSGLSLALIMCLRVLTLVLASAWVQRTVAPGALVEALARLRVPRPVALTVDATLALVGGAGGRGDGKGSGARRKRDEHKDEQQPDDNAARLTFAQIRQGDLSYFTALIDRQLERAREFLGERHPDLGERPLHDLTVILTVSVAIMSLKLLQVMPGLPIAPGHKNILVVPLFLFASRMTYMRWGGSTAGLAVGIVSFMLGYGKFGILENAHFVVPGVLADLLMPLAYARSRGMQIVQYAAIGAVLGFGRFAANLLVIVLAGAPQIAFVLFLPALISQVSFGALSCFVSLVIVNRAPESEALRTSAQPDPGSMEGDGKLTGTRSTDPPVNPKEHNV